MERGYSAEIGGIDQVIVSASQLLAVDLDDQASLRGSRFSHPAIIEDGAVALRGEEIVWSGKTIDVLPLLPLDGGVRLWDAAGFLVTPGLIDPHTHIVFGGTREDEFEARIGGKSYMEIAAGGGGIKRTVRMTRAASFEQLYESGMKRLEEMLDLGITTIEVKSGYGLERETELKMLRVACALGESQPVEIVTTFLGAHEFPPDMSRDRYLALLIDDMIPAVVSEGLAEFCDVFLERGVYTEEEATRVLDSASTAGLVPKVHADQMTDGGGAAFAVRCGAISADHLNHTGGEGIAALAASDCVGVLLPGSDFFLGLPKYPDARAMIAADGIVSLATDFNPGSCMTGNLPLVMTIACTQMRMTPAEAFSAVTLNAARAIGRSDRIGSLQPGRRADIVLFDCPNYQMVCYHFGKNHAKSVFTRGRVVRGRPAEIGLEDLHRRYSSDSEG